MKLLILDIDGTLADNSHREHLAEEENWDEFFSPDLVAKILLLRKCKNNMKSSKMITTR